MTPRFQKFLKIIALLAVGYVALKLVYPSYSYRLRMTVEVKVGTELRTGSSVVEITIQQQPQLLGVTARSSAKGEAVFVDLGQGRNITALLTSGEDGRAVDYPQGLVPNLFGLTHRDDDLPKLEKLRGQKVIPNERLPALITFSDLKDPRSARSVLPSQFEVTFGPEVHFHRMLVELTDAPVTRGIERRLLWWDLPGRPAEVALRAAGLDRAAITPEFVFVR